MIEPFSKKRCTPRWLVSTILTVCQTASKSSQVKTSPTRISSSPMGWGLSSYARGFMSTKSALSTCFMAAAIRSELIILLPGIQAPWRKIGSYRHASFKLNRQINVRVSWTIQQNVAVVTAVSCFSMNPDRFHQYHLLKSLSTISSFDFPWHVQLIAA